MDYETKGISRKKIRIIARIIRKYLKIRTIRFPVMNVLEQLVVDFEDILVYEVLPDEKFDKNVMAFIETYDYCCIEANMTSFHGLNQKDRKIFD